MDAGGDTRAAGRGRLALVLHAHLPYVEGFGTWPFGEEWLHEAVATAYVPLLAALRGAAGVSVGLTPVLGDQLELLPHAPGERLLAYIEQIRLPAHEEDAAGFRSVAAEPFAAELARAAGDYRSAAEAVRARGGDLLGAFAELERSGVELWTSCATHAVLPLLATEAGRRLQVAAGVAAHERRFGGFGGGFWVPECAYEPGLERELAELGVSCFCVDATAQLGLGSLDHLEPVAAGGGTVAVPIDWETIALVWDNERGYPAHPAYRDYHRPTEQNLKPWSNAGDPYDHAAAAAVAREHARDFVRRVGERLDAFRAERGRPGLVCVALDAELLGHWWYEGPGWLAGVLEQAPGLGVELVSLPRGLAGLEPVERPLEPSTWGRGKDMGTWDSPRVAEFAFGARDAELRTVARAARPGASGPALERAARELLALQSSDWAFMEDRRLAADYPLRRFRDHLADLDAALAAAPGEGPPPALRGLAPGLDLTPLMAP